MSKNLYWNLELSIKEGRFDDFKTLVEDMSERVQQHEPGTLNYEWTADADKANFHIYERYVNSEALMTHMAGFQEHFAERFFDVLEIKRWCLYGNPSDQVKETLGGLGVEFFEPVGGFAR